MRGVAFLKKFAGYLIDPYSPPARVEGVPSAVAVVPKLVEKFKLNESEVYKYLESVGLPVPRSSQA